MGRNPHLGRFQALTRNDKNIIQKALDITGTEHLRNSNINELSGGECRLAVIARALATEAPLMLMDEPTSDLDIKHSLTIMELLCELREKGKTILVNIHDLNFARRYCDTVSIINAGRFVFSGNPAEALSEENIRNVFGVGMTEVKTSDASFLHFYH